MGELGHTDDGLERGLELFLELLTEDAELEEELARSQRTFHGEAAPREARSPSEGLLAERRHLEWFLLERPSARLEGVPAEALQASWRELAEAVGHEDRVLFLESLCGVFEVTSTEAGRVLWARDLFALGEYPVSEPASARGVEVGDLVVGRLFPLRDGRFRLSPAAAVFRTPRLLEAVRRDLERMREGRRGVLRIQQVELERLFFSTAGAFAGETPLSPATDGDVRVPRGLATAATPGSGSSTVDPPSEIGAERARARESLRDAGLPEAQVEAVIARLQAEAGSADPAAEGIVLELLNELAFATDADLEASRRALLELWWAERALCGASSAPAAAVQESAGSDGDDAVGTEEVRRALEAFDRARAAGDDLESAFEGLAADLGVSVEADGEPAQEAQEFPGVVGAMVEEFLWDVGREQGATAAARFEVLRRFSAYGQDIGVFENLARRDLVDFAGRWLLDEGHIEEVEDVAPMVAALEAFTAWCEERHSLPLGASCGDLFPILRAELPRLLELRSRCWPHREGDEPWDVLEVNSGSLDVRNVAGISHTVAVPEDLCRDLRPGDLLHARQEGRDFAITRCYPEVLRELVDGR